VKKIAVLVEGETEWQFVQDVLQPHLNADSDLKGYWLTPIIVGTSKGREGRKFRGGGKWKHYDKDLRNLLGQGHWHRVGLLLDYYAYPSGAPGAEQVGEGRARHDALIRALTARYPDRRFVPGVALHEFETWVIAAGVGRPTVLEERPLAEAFQAIAAKFGDDVELINDSPATAPSKRVARAWPGYQKAIDGVAAIQDAGLEHVVAQCPSLKDWLDRLCAP
jgi:Domain of unknown function (DUF4276)